MKESDRYEIHFGERIDLLDYKTVIDNPKYKSAKFFFIVYAWIHLLWYFFESSFHLSYFEPIMMFTMIPYLIVSGIINLNLFCWVM